MSKFDTNLLYNLYTEAKASLVKGRLELENMLANCEDDKVRIELQNILDCYLAALASLDGES